MKLYSFETECVVDCETINKALQYCIENCYSLSKIKIDAKNDYFSCSFVDSKHIIEIEKIFKP